MSENNYFWKRSFSTSFEVLPEILFSLESLYLEFSPDDFFKWKSELWAQCAEINAAQCFLHKKSGIVDLL